MSEWAHYCVDNVRCFIVIPSPSASASVDGTKILVESVFLEIKQENIKHCGSSYCGLAITCYIDSECGSTKKIKGYKYYIGSLRFATENMALDETRQNQEKHQNEITTICLSFLRAAHINLLCIDIETNTHPFRHTVYKNLFRWYLYLFVEMHKKMCFLMLGTIVSFYYAKVP